MKKLVLALLLVSLSALGMVSASDDLAKNFAKPPDSARPWVYWFWLNSNITRAGITADLEAMKRVGIGGVLIMEVDQGAPTGPASFMGRQWRELFKHAVAEARRLGLEVNMNDDAGWNGSGGPWIKPEQSMQKIVWTETGLTGPRRFEGPLPQPEANRGFYRDIAVLAFPAPGDFRIPDIKSKALYERRDVAPAAETKLPPEMVIAPGRLVDLTARLDKTGRLAWDVPEGKWTVLRLGHTGTGVENAPAPASGRGLECDKLSKEGIEAQFAGMMAKLIADVGPAAGTTLVATHIDSWENGAQNWTARMREEFRKRRGYDLLPFLPAVTGRVVDSLEISERFLWDLRQTANDLLLENYAGHMRALAAKHGLRLSIEAYGGPTDDISYGGRADEPMGEFWIGGGAFETLKQMASAAHIYGRPILGAEAFTATDRERWLQHPGTIKALGDRAFAEGVNRFVFHRYAMQPWRDYRPGMSMGPWGLHYERTSTWWDESGPWHEYLARCQYLLRQGTFVADICSLQPEASPQEFKVRQRAGYDFDTCTAEVVLTRMSVKNGRLLLPDGLSYGVLELPDTVRMTPALLRKVKELAAAGATVVGPTRPAKAPGLSNYPECDAEVKSLSADLWERGGVVRGKTAEQALAGQGIPADFSAPAFVRWIHRRAGDTEIYFVASRLPQAADATCTFRVGALRPEFWLPETGDIKPVPVYDQAGGLTRIPIRFDPSGSVFVVFRPGAAAADPVVKVSLGGRQIIPAPEPKEKEKVVIVKADYGVPGDPKRMRDVRARLQKLVDGGEFEIQAGRLAEGDDPAFGVVKTVEVEYTLAGKRFSMSGKDPETLIFAFGPVPELAAEIQASGDGRLSVDARRPGRYELRTASGRKLQAVAPPVPPPYEIGGPWEVSFPPKWGAPAHVTMDKLVSWSGHPDPGVKYFSGTATYSKKFAPPQLAGGGRRIDLDLGQVQVMARVKLNGRDLGVLWKKPYCLDVTDVLKPGENELEIRVTNLWVNRMIGDEQLAEDSDRNPDGTLKAWPKWVLEGKPSPTGRFTFTSWRLWKKDDAPIESGMLGPVTLSVRERAEVR
jgi:hypothetical protein